jgi:hypothetical protein
VFFIACFIVICIFLITVIPAYLKNRKELEEDIQSSISNDEKIIHKQTLGVHYLGGHPPFGSYCENGDMVITNKRIIFSEVGNKKIFSISYEDMVDISMETKESLTVTRVILTGLLAPLWKKKRPFILIGMKNDIGKISSVGFGFAEPGLGSSFWPTSRWFQVISEQRYGLLKNKKQA